MRSGSWGRIALALAAAGVVATGCGGSSSTASASPTPSPSPSPSAVRIATVDACALVSAQDASDAAGTTLVQAPTGGGASAASICIFGSQSSSSSSAGVIVLAQVYPDTTTADAVQADQVAAAMGAQFGVSGVTNAKVVPGIGDKAVEYTATSSAGGGTGIFVFKSNVVLFIVVSPGDPTKVENLARTALTNLAKVPTA